MRQLMPVTEAESVHEHPVGVVLPVVLVPDDWLDIQRFGS